MRPPSRVLRRALTLAVALVGLAVIASARAPENATSPVSLATTGRPEIDRPPAIPLRSFAEPTLADAIKNDSLRRWYAAAAFVTAAGNRANSRPVSSATTSGYVGSSDTGAGLTIWYRLADCESSGDWTYNGPSGFDGGLQFSPSTWTANGGGEFAPYAWGASPEQQITVARRVLASQGPGAWPVCGRRVGLTRGS